jgi:hypothetical protein
MKRRVRVWGEAIDIDVEQKSRTVWVAIGEYKGEHHETTDSSAATAAMRWVEWAKYKGG